MVKAKRQFEKFIGQKGLRHTLPRQQVLEVFLATEKHVTVQELYDLVRKKHKAVGYATVARTGFVSGI